MLFQAMSLANKIPPKQKSVDAHEFGIVSFRTVFIYWLNFFKGININSCLLLILKLYMQHTKTKTKVSLV